MKSLINILSETITGKLYEEEEETLIDAQVTPPNDESNHYLNKTPDKGWKEFWLDWNGDDEWQNLSPSTQDEYRDEVEASSREGIELEGPQLSLTDEEFRGKYGKSRGDFKKDFRDEVVAARTKAIDKYVARYNPENKATYNKVYKQVKEGVLGTLGAHHRTREILNGMITKLQNMKKKSKTLVHYNNQDIKKANGNAMSNSWGWVWPSVGPPQGTDVYNINLHNFTNPSSLDTWRKKLYNTTYHEIGHNLAHMFDEYGIKAYQDIKSQDIFADEAIADLLKATGGHLMWKGRNATFQEMIAKQFDMTIEKITRLLSNEYYVNRPAEDYARIQRLRDEFGAGGDKTYSAQWWAAKFYQKVQNGDITTGDVMQTRDLLIPKYGFPGREEKKHRKKWDWEYVCGIQQFLWSQGVKGVGEMVNGREVCDGGYGKNTKDAVTKFYKDMITLSKTKTRIFFTIPKSMLKYNDLADPPTSYSDLWVLLANALWWNNEQVWDIAALFAKSVWDTKSLTIAADEIIVAIDFNWIKKEDDTFVDASDEIGDDLDYKIT